MNTTLTSSGQIETALAKRQRYAIWAERGLLFPELPQMLGFEYGRNFWEAVLRWGERDQKWGPYFDKKSFRILGSPVMPMLPRRMSTLTEGEIWRLAQAEIEQHGDAAYLHLAGTLGETLGDGDEVKFTNWMRVLAAMGQIDARKPQNARLH